MMAGTLAKITQITLSITWITFFDHPKWFFTDQ